MHTTRIALVAALALSACGGERTLEAGHSEATALEVRSADNPDVLIARWEEEGTWTNADGAEIDALPASAWNGSDFEPLVAGGAPVRLLLRWEEGDGAAVDMTHLREDATTKERLCGEFSTRYYLLDDSADGIAWPNLAHPDSADGYDLFAETEDGELAPIFNCSEVTLIPEVTGSIDLFFVVWHVSHADVETLPLRVEIAAGG